MSCMSESLSAVRTELETRVIIVQKSNVVLLSNIGICPRGRRTSYLTKEHVAGSQICICARLFDLVTVQLLSCSDAKEPTP